MFTTEKVHTLETCDGIYSPMPSLDDANFNYSCGPSEDEENQSILHDSILWHFFCHPKAAINRGIGSHECRNRLPKRLSPLIYEPDNGYPIGYGIEFVEGFNWQFCFLCESFVGFIAIGFPILWMLCSKRMDRVSTALAAGQWIFGAGQVLYLIVVALSEALCIWGY